MAEFYRRGWHPDPYGVHAERYFYADNQPGRLVRDDRRIESYDDIPPVAKARPPPRPRRISGPRTLHLYRTAYPLVRCRCPPPPSGRRPRRSEYDPPAVDALAIVPDAPRLLPYSTARPYLGASGRRRISRRSPDYRGPPAGPSRHRAVALVVVLASSSLSFFRRVRTIPQLPGQQPSSTNPQLRVPSNFLNGARHHEHDGRPHQGAPAPQQRRPGP